MDYVQFSYRASFPAFSKNGTRMCTSFNVIDDNERELIEYFSLNLDNESPDLVTLLEGEDALIVRILDDDGESQNQYLYWDIPDSFVKMSQLFNKHQYFCTTTLYVIMRIVQCII